MGDPLLRRPQVKHLPFRGALTTAYWTEVGRSRTELLDGVVAYLARQRWGKVIDAGWSNWDLRIYCQTWTVVEVCTAQEEHGAGKRLIRVGYRLRLRECTKVFYGVGLLATLGMAGINVNLAAAMLAVVLAAFLAVWWHGAGRAARAVRVFDAVAEGLRLIRCDPAARRAAKGQEGGAG
jgi:hypothetical protein